MKVALFGSGQIAWIHGRQIVKQSGVSLVGIADTDLARAGKLARALGVESVYQDGARMIDEQRPDIVHVLTPPFTHADVATLAMSRGCHVLVEKPMATDLPAARAMVETAQRQGVRLCADHNLLFEDVVQRARKLVLDGVVGDVVSVEAYYSYNAGRNPALLEEGAQHCHWSYRLNGGPLEDLLPHMAYLALEFMPSEITDVKVMGQNRGVLPQGWDDELRLLVRSDRVLGFISISLSERPDVISLTVKGTTGQVSANLFSGVLTVQTGSPLPRAVARGLSGFRLSAQSAAASLGNLYSFATGRMDKSGGIGSIIAKFYEAVRTGAPTPVSLDDCVRVVDFTARVWPVPAVPPEPALAAPRLRASAPPATVLITGASGFIGTHLVKRLLSENLRVRALVRRNSYHAGRLRDLDVDIVEGDLTDSDAIDAAARGVKTIYHAGAATNNEWDENQRVTIDGTSRMLEAALAHGAERFVLFSSLAVHDVSRSRGRVLTEDAPFPRNPRQKGAYSHSKIVAEGLALAAYREHGLPVTIVRPGMVIGPFGRVLFPHLGYHYGDRMFMLLGRGDQVLPLTYIENTVDGIYRAATLDRAIGQVYNLVDEGRITARQYLTRFIATTGLKAKIVGLPYLLPYSATAAYEIAAALGVVAKGVTSRGQLRDKWRPAVFDSAKAREELGWAARVPLEAGLDETFRWYARTYRTPAAGSLRRTAVDQALAPETQRVG
jgi:nucleoside-diphosphate-sugar epimerase/predicted dehydrogenase